MRRFPLTLLCVSSVASNACLAATLLPPPRSWEQKPGLWHLPVDIAISAPREWRGGVKSFSWLISESLASLLRSPVQIDVKETGGVIRIEQADHSVPPGDGYELLIQPEGVTIRAAAPGGVFNAFATLGQLIEQAPAKSVVLECCRIVDQPALAVRAGHIDMTCQQYNARYVQSLMRTLARYKINAILMEYSDMFPFRDHRGICRPDAFTEQDIIDIRRTAAECNIEIIPFLQCLGHLDYVLHKPDYRELGKAHRQYMLCPTSPRTLPFVQGLIDEILAQHPEAKRLHVGGDEVQLEPKRGGGCEQCAAFVEREGYSRLYVNHYKPVAEYCLSRKVTPLMWSDMMLAHPEAIEDLPRGIGVVVWDYGITHDPAPVLFHGAVMGSLNRLTPAYRKYFGESIGLPQAEQRGGLVAFGHAPGFQALGFGAFTAPAARCGGDNFDLPRYELHLNNIRVAFRKAAEFGLPGAIITSWSYRGSPHEVCLPEYACAAYGWNPEMGDVAAFLSRFFKQRYGLSEPRLAATALSLSKVLPPSTIATPKRDDARDAWVVSAETQFEQIKTAMAPARRADSLATWARWGKEAGEAIQLLGGAASAPRNAGELEHWTLSLRHLEHRLNLLQSLAPLVAVAYLGETAPAADLAVWKDRLQRSAAQREQLRQQWAHLYTPQMTARHLEIELYNRFAAEAEMIGAVLDELKAEKASTKPASGSPTTTAPMTGKLRLGVVGLVHAHVWGFFQDAVKRGDIEIVGMAEPREELLRRYGTQHKFPESIWFRDLDRMLDTARPQAVVVFTDTLEHRKVVEACAPRGIHVMMEKPLATSMEHARAIERAAMEGKIHVLVNYETSWYPNTQAACELISEKGRIGPIRKIVVHDGHQGPKEIGMPREFMEWLTDPARNGAGALFDFGCYGANLATCLMGEQRPLSVTAVTQKLKSDPVYQRVDDEATIVVTYPKTQAVIQASWNWPFSRKDMEIYGEQGHFLTVERDMYRMRTLHAAETLGKAEPIAAPKQDPISYLVAVVRGEILPSGPSSLKVNLIATEILDAARRSAERGVTISLADVTPP